MLHPRCYECHPMLRSLFWNVDKGIAPPPLPQPHHSGCGERDHTSHGPQAFLMYRRNLQELPSDDMEERSNEPPEAPPAGIYYAGDKVLVERSNGSTSEASIVEYDEVRSECLRT